MDQVTFFRRQTQIHLLGVGHGNRHMEKDAVMIFPVIISALVLSQAKVLESDRVEKSTQDIRNQTASQNSLL